MPKLLVVLISGKQGSGKSSTARALIAELGTEFSVIPYRFADPLYRMHDAVLDVMRGLGISVPVKDGRLLQLIGTEWGRQVYGHDVWVDCARGFIENCREECVRGLRDCVVVIDDCRFRNELAAFLETGLCFRLEADRETRKARTDGWRDTDTHSSETDLDDSLTSFDAVYRTDLNTTTAAIAQDMASQVRSFLALGTKLEKEFY